MGRQKTKRFEQNSQARNIIEEGKELYKSIKGNWQSFFGNNKPIVVELACGRGEYCVGLGAAFPDKNFLGVDIKGYRLWKGSQQAMAQHLDNVAFLRAYIQNIEEFIAPNEIDELWITFPDPWPKNHDQRRRLTHFRFLQFYQRMLKPKGIVHLKTDNTGLYLFTLEVLQAIGVDNLQFTDDLYNSPYASIHLGIKTRFEEIWTDKGENIKYLSFQFRDEPISLPANFEASPYPGYEKHSENITDTPATTENV